MSFITENKSTIIKVVIVIALLVGAFAAGRYTLPAKVVEVEKVVEVVKEVVKTEIQVVEKKVYIKGEARDVVREVVIVKAPDGTETTKITETDKTKTVEASTQESSSQATVVKTEDKAVAVERVTVTENPKDWHLSLSVGAGARFIGEMTPEIAFGLTVERRIVGPFFMGLNLAAEAVIAPMATPALQPPVTITGALVFGVEF
jgi:hypothetical protein